MKVLNYLVLLLSTSLVGCSTELKEYQNHTPELRLFSYFQGDTEAWGMVQDYTNKQTRRFHVTIKGHVSGDVLTLNERFIYHDGEKQTRVWHITRLANGHYQGIADDIIGVASGAEVGNTLRWQYDFNLKLDDGNVIVSFDDWLFRQDERHLFNVSYIKKFGFTVGKVILFFEKK